MEGKPKTSEVLIFNTAVERSPDYREDDTQDDITSNSCNPEKFHEVFGVYPATLEQEIKALETKKEVQAEHPTWLRHVDPKKPAAFYKVVDTVPIVPAGDRIAPNKVQVHNAWVERLINMVRGFSICFHLCYTLCPPIPSVITKKIAFFPPASPFYFFKIVKEDGTSVIGNAESAYGKGNVTVELAPFEGEHTILIEGVVGAFSVMTSRRNYLACVRICCTLKHRPPSMKKKIVIFCQPNSSDLGMFIWKRNTSGLTLGKVADRLGVDVVSFDYSGFGMSTGTASEVNLYEDIKAVYEYVRKTDPEKKIFLMGLSLGTAACIHQAMSNPSSLAGLILLAPFTSGIRVLMATPSRSKPYKLDSFRSIEKISKVRVPVFIAHGLLDDVIAYDHGVALLKQCQRPAPIQLVREADHTTVFTVGVSKKVLNFVAREAEGYPVYYNKEYVIRDLEDELKKIAAGLQNPTIGQSSSSNSSSAPSLSDSEDISLLEEEIEKIESEEAISCSEENLTQSARVYNHAAHLKSQARMPKNLVVNAIKSRFSLDE